MTDDDRANELRLEAERLRSKADRLAELADAISGQSTADWLGMGELSSEYSFTRQSLAAAYENGLSVSRDAKSEIAVRRRDVDAWIESRRWKPPPKVATPGGRRS